MGRPGARTDRQAGPDRHGCQSVTLEHRHRRNAAHGHRSRLDLRGTLRYGRHEGTRGGEGYRAALLPGTGRLRPLAAGRERRTSPLTGPAPTSSTKEKSSAGVTMPTPIIRSSTLSTRTTSATSAEAWQRRCNESRPNVWSSAFRPTSSSPCPKCRRCTGCCRAAPTTRSTPPSDTTGFWSSTNN